MVFQVIVALSATFIISSSQVVTKEQTETLQGNFPTFASLSECQAGLLQYTNKINASAGARLGKFVEDNAAALGADAVRRDKYKIRCGRNAADESQDE
jgi:hypothetical protein